MFSLHPGHDRLDAAQAICIDDASLNEQHNEVKHEVQQ